MNKKLTQEEVFGVLKELEGNILIVEGKKDEAALRSLLSQPTIIVMVNSRPIEKVALHTASLMEKHKSREVIILTDFDRTGSKMASRLRPFLQRLKIHANSRIRRDVMNLGINRIEEMARILSEQALPDEQVTSARTPSVSRIAKIKERDDYGQTGPNFYEVRGKSPHKGKRRNREA
jgi:5S rRNA maturation endonuclease (ribonuclease M5)